MTVMWPVISQSAFTSGSSSMSPHALLALGLSVRLEFISFSVLLRRMS